MRWLVELHAAFEPEFDALAEPVQDELAALMLVLAERGPQLSRPRADTLKGSRHANMKELRFEAGGGVWRAAFAFDPRRRAIILVAGDKAGVSQRAFYRRLIAKADARFDQHLDELKRRR